jgi:hypothetical protein
MHKARSFFLVCSGIFLLALAYHLGAKSAQGQSPSTLLAMTDYPRAGSSAVALDKAGGIYFGQSRQWSQVGSTPSTPAGIWSRPSTGEVFIPLENGDLYRLEADWTLTYDSNVFGGGPTPATQESWGGVKAKYRPGGGAATQAK